MELGNETSFGDLEEVLKQHAASLNAAIADGNFKQAMQVIHELNLTRDQGLYHEVGKLTRGLHNAIVNFQIDAEGNTSEDVSQISDATDRLSYVVKLTEKAANRTMDLVELSTPLAGELTSQARGLREEWGKLIRREVGPAEFRDLYKRIDAFLEQAEGTSSQLSGNLNEILLAQDFQDLTGQVIKRVTGLVKEVEGSLVKLMVMASQVDRYTGLVHDATHIREEKNISSKGEGPQIHADKREDVVSGQDDVDDLLSSLGF
ncbi:protein phosphatase CheZ [Atopomonas sediminilitoris]|uniref:protein phosphatase CheZ n=1 Tax=Atopomonas sediminilitoris TaxID=2919919 RepID=UPI001F4D7C9C|nr:protein phosphatase CheZ [Atopomonas sediminilitoris]MCJ8167930.1 protein phosphatase CheZ [Atopomonas sediminilitoris]